MGLLNKIQSAFSKKAAGDSTFGGEWTSIIGGNVDGVSEQNLLLNNKEWVYIAVDKVALAVASIRFKVMRVDRKGDDQEVFDGPLVEFLEKPGVGFTGKDFIYLNTVYKELTGNAFWERDGKKVIPLIPTQVTPDISGNQLTGYKYRDGAIERKLQLDEVLHDRYINPAKPYWGVGRLQKIARWVDTHAYAEEFLRLFFINGAHFGGFIETEEESKERIALIKAGLANDHAGVANSHKWGVLPKGSKATRMTANMTEIEMTETDNRFRDKILAAFGVPKPLIGLAEQVQRGNVEASEYIFARYTIQPIADDFLEFLNVYVAQVLDPNGEYYFAYDEFVPVNQEIELREREIALNRQPYKTVNEVRAEQGLPPVSGGDVVYGPPFQSPLGEAMAYPEPAQSVPDDEDDDVPTKRVKHRLRGVSARVRAFEKREKSKDALWGAVEALYKDVDERDLADAAAHKDFEGRVETYLERVANAVRLFNSEQQARIVKDLGHITKAVSKGDLFDFEAEVALMVNFVEPLLRGLMTEQALAEYEAQGYEGVFDSGADALRKTVEKATKRLAKTYNNTTAVLLTKELNEGINAGDSLNQLTQRVAKVYDFSDKSRAKAVAHTESFYIANEGSKEAYRQSGVVESIRWYTAEDERVCPWCEPQNGKIVGVNENFYNKGDQLVDKQGNVLSLDYRAINVPPIHTNCRCFVRPEEIVID